MTLDAMEVKRFLIFVIEFEGIVSRMHVQRSEMRFEDETIVREKWYQVIISIRTE